MNHCVSACCMHLDVVSCQGVVNVMAEVLQLAFVLRALSLLHPLKCQESACTHRQNIAQAGDSGTRQGHRQLKGQTAAFACQTRRTIILQDHMVLGPPRLTTKLAYDYRKKHALLHHTSVSIPRSSPESPRLAQAICTHLRWEVQCCCTTRTTSAGGVCHLLNQCLPLCFGHALKSVGNHTYLKAVCTADSLLIPCLLMRFLLDLKPAPCQNKHPVDHLFCSD